MSLEIHAGLLGAFLSGVAVGLLLALVVIPAVVDQWAETRRCGVSFDDHRRGR